MDGHSSHLNLQTGSRGSSQMPYPSHSASSLHHNSHHIKRKLPDDQRHRQHYQPTPFPPSSDTTTNDSISARPNSSYSDSDEGDEFHDNGTSAQAPSAADASSIRTFTAARLESSCNNNDSISNGGSNGVVVGGPGGRGNGSSNISNSCGGDGSNRKIKVENVGVVKLEKEELAKTNGTGSAGGSGKEDAYSAREERLKREVER